MKKKDSCSISQIHNFQPDPIINFNQVTTNYQQNKEKSTSLALKKPFEFSNKNLSLQQYFGQLLLYYSFLLENIRKSNKQLNNISQQNICVRKNQDLIQSSSQIQKQNQHTIKKIQKSQKQVLYENSDDQSASLYHSEIDDGQYLLNDNQEEQNSLRSDQQNQFEQIVPQKKLQTYNKQQLLKLIAYLYCHEKDFQTKRMLIYKQCSQYVTNGNSHKIQNKLQKRKRKQRTFRQYADYLKDKHSFSDYQVQQEIRKLKQYQKQAFQIYPQQWIEQSKFIQAISKYDPQDLDHKCIKLFLNEFTPYINLKDLKYRLIPYTNSSQKIQTAGLKFVVLISFNLVFNLQQAYSIVQNWRQQQPQQSNELNLIEKQSDISAKNSLIVKSDFLNKQIEVQILEKIYRIDRAVLQPPLLTKAHNLASTNNIKNKLLYQRWLRIQTFRLLIFMKVYSQFCNNIKDVRFNYCRIMSQFIKTKNQFACYDHCLYLAKIYNNLDELVFGQMKKYCISKQDLMKEVNKQVKRCRYRNRLVFCESKTKQIRVIQQQKSIRQQDAKKLIKQHLQNLQIQIKFL